MIGQMKSLVLLALASGAAVSLRAAGVTVDGSWKIVYSDASESSAVRRALRVAGQEVSEDICEAVGIRLPVVEASRAGNPAHAIYIGAEPARAAGFDLGDLTWWTCRYAEKDGNVYCFGNDREGVAKCPSPEWFRCLLPSVKAVGHFLQDVVGVRFVMTGRVGTEVPKRDRIEIAGGLSRRVAFEHWFGSSRAEGDHMVSLIARGDIPMGVACSHGGHLYPAACDSTKDFDAHPEWFAMNKLGHRVRGPTRGQSALCISNPEVEERLCASMKASFAGGAAIVELGQQDGLNVCQCEKCRALYGTGDDWSEKFWLFHRHLAERMERECPGLTVMIISYALTGDPPKTFRRFPKNVMIELCDYTESSFMRWHGYEVPCGFSAYLYLWGNYPLPGYTPKRSFESLADLAARLRRHNVKGLYRCGGRGLEAIEGPQYYYLDRLLSEPGADAAKTLAEYCDAAYGPRAGAKIREFFTILDRCLVPFCRESMGHFEASAAERERQRLQTPLETLGRIYDPASVARMQALVEAAGAEPMSDRQRIRFRRLKLEWAYARNMGAIANDWKAYWEKPGAGRFAKLAADVRFRRRFLDRVFDPEFRKRFSDEWSRGALFCGDARERVDQNGRLGAVIHAPLEWDVDEIERSGLYPGDPTLVSRRRAYNREKGLKPVGKWSLWNAKQGVCEVRPDGSGFRFSPGPGGTDVRVVGRVFGLKPDTRYRCSWFFRLENVSKTKREGGFYACVDWDYGPEAPPHSYLREPAGGVGHVGTQDWQFQSAVFTTRAKDAFAGITFRILNGSGTAEVENVTIEEL